eukprot:7007609-Prymnesium_polylepis.1
MCDCASVCGAGHAHLRGWNRPTSPHALPRAFGAACSAAAETSPTSSRPRPAISAAKPLHTSVHTCAFPPRSPPAPQNRPPHAGSPHSAQSRNRPGASRTTVYLLPAAAALPPFRHAQPLHRCPARRRLRRPGPPRVAPL